MVWYANYYCCYRCEQTWLDEWSCACDDECPHCGAQDCSPEESEDLSGYIDEEDGEYVVYVSPANAEHYPDYQEIGRYASKRIAQTIMNRRMKMEWEMAFG